MKGRSDVIDNDERMMSSDGNGETVKTGATKSSSANLVLKSLADQLEPHGSVPPHSSRLLKILPDGYPLYEPTQLLPEEDETDGIEKAQTVRRHSYRLTFHQSIFHHQYLKVLMLFGRN